MTTTHFTRQQLLEGLDAFTSLWTNTNHIPSEHLFTEQVEMFTSHRGPAAGHDAVLAKLHSDFAGLEGVRIMAANVVPRAAGTEGLVGAYIHGEARKATPVDGQAVAFGGVLLLSFEHDGERMRIATARFQLNWVDGDSTALAGWKIPPQDRLWKAGDAPAQVVSELDAPWHRIPISELLSSDTDAIAETWFRYAWGLDQADFALFSQVFSEDVEAELTPMGRMKGRRTLITTLKAFRMPWPWMKHYGAPIQVNISPDAASATLVIGRIIPGQTRAPDGKSLYGAHYRIRALRNADGIWQISQMEYIPGWISTE